MFSYDAALLDIVQAAPQSIPGVLHTLHAIDSTCADADGLKWFNWLYLQVTEAVEDRVAAGEFADTAWLAELDVQFAALYFAALKSALSGQTTPGCWRVLFQCRSQGAIARIQFAIAGINAHINHDLPEAIVATCQATGCTPDRAGTNYRDYTALNTTFDSLVEAAKVGLNVRLPGDALPPVSHVEQTLAAWSVSAARESAWQTAEQLWLFRSSPLLNGSLLNAVDGLTTVIGKTLLVPAP